MEKYDYIDNFKKLGLGIFVHFGLYSILESGEWTLFLNKRNQLKYNELTKKFNPGKTWAKNLVKVAKKAGAKYIVLTTRHHDGFSLYDTKGLNDFDSIHSKCGRDLVKEFVDECNKEKIIPFFYHTLLDWYNKAYENDFRSYLEYLRLSIEILLKNYGKIGGFWFDGMWDKKDEDWEEDKLYSLIRKHQPKAMIINNTGLKERGKVGSLEIDSVTFERGKPFSIKEKKGLKPLAKEMCQTLSDHWGYAKNDFEYKSLRDIIDDLAECRHFGANLLLNVGPKKTGYLRKLDEAILFELGNWIKINEEALRNPIPTKIKIMSKKEDFLLQDGSTYYLFCRNLPMMLNQNVTLFKEGNFIDEFKFDKKIVSVKWLDSDEKLSFSQKDSLTTIKTNYFEYGKNLVIRIAKIETK